MPLRATTALRAAAGLCVALAAACENPNQGVTPSTDRIFFPSGLLLDPTGDPALPARYLFVANSNTDLSFNAGTLIAVDLDAFFDAWSDEELGVYPFCEEDEVDEEGEEIDNPRCVRDPGAKVDDQFPCRRLALLPQIVECDEAPFVVPGGVRLGDFATVLAASFPDAANRSRMRVWVPVRGDPSVTYVDVDMSDPSGPRMDCDQGEDPDDPLRCGDRHRLTHLRNDSTLPAIEREPFNIVISEAEDRRYRYGYVAHSSGAAFSLIDLDGLQGGGRPAIVDSVPLFPSNGFQPGGFGIAERPCQLGDPDDPDSANVPSVAQGCTRPLIYASYRFDAQLTSFTASGIDDLPQKVRREDNNTCFEVKSDENDPDVFLGQFCAEPADLGEACAVVCEPTVKAVQVILPGGLDRGVSARPALGDVIFPDERGDELLVVQTNPGALLKLNTTLGDDNEPRDVPSVPPLEVCDEPTRMKVAGDFAFITCFRAALIYVVDLNAFRVVSTIVAGTGPHELAVDPARGMLFAANTLEASITVVDIRPESRTRFREVARIGLQDPFSQ